MARSLLFTFALVLASVAPARASDIGVVKCGPNQDRVWVYESLNSFDVETRLKCNETVEILSRVRGYVKIRTASGVEGYVTDSAFPDLPALPPEDSEKPIASFAARATSANSAARVNVMPPPPVAPALPAAPAPVTQPTPAAQPTAQPAAPVASTVAAPPAPASVPKTSALAPEKTAHAAADVKPASAVASSSHAKPRQKSVTPAEVAEPPAPKKTPVKPVPAPAVTTQSAQSTIIVPQPAPSAAMVVPAKATVAPSGAALLSASANAPAKTDITINEPARDPDLEEYTDTKPENESADPSCRMFFSAYGLAPAQYRWMVETRKKEFSGICPAPDLAHVDFIILFAHDSDTFNSSMPVPVHTDRSGFSDFNPISTMDNAIQSASELDKARYEFVWVFHTKRGTFDPAKFSVRRRPLFTTDAKGSHAASRAVEDAFHFIEGQGNPTAQ